MTSLAKRALAAGLEKEAEERQYKIDQREKSLDEALEAWPRSYRIGSKLDLPVPDRASFKRRNHVPQSGGGRNSHVSGWAVEVDGITFLVNGSTYDGGDWVIVRCPDCGCEHAADFFDLKGLGKVLKAQRHFLHRCLDIELRQLAYAIGIAMRDTNLGRGQVVDEATERFGDVILKAARR